MTYGGIEDTTRFAAKVSLYVTPGIWRTAKMAGIFAERLNPDSSRNSRDHTYGVSYAGVLVVVVVAAVVSAVLDTKNRIGWE